MSSGTLVAPHSPMIYLKSWIFTQYKGYRLDFFSYKAPQLAYFGDSTRAK